MPEKTSLGMGSEPQMPNGTSTAVQWVRMVCEDDRYEKNR